MKLNAENLLAAAGLSLAASVLVPMLKGVVGAESRGAFAGAVGMSDRGRKAWSFVQEEIEDFLAEVQFERIKNNIDREMGGGPES
ncbi:MAG: hypothetical protein K6T81_15595 [Alicyclobacillus macrosporangiidus]|uniref:hypothetical protein n=1 Tax=Alicyclobacillus macrosporangiidus TaxID=392015 RepID=UPI0026ED7DCB|nr:hypothetical protein [Alicyclobacillus macrosporangiidus]MCL6600141.1 hypothetical protein [Alicyclobacillus macrosporangiidus]